jgi:hypothetical protein
VLIAYQTLAPATNKPDFALAPRNALWPFQKPAAIDAFNVPPSMVVDGRIHSIGDRIQKEHAN